MREIKFRVWDKKEKAFIVPFDFALNGMGSKFICPDNKLIDHGNFSGDCEQERYEIQQFTGIKDKNGKEIYEGDILRISFSSYAPNSDHVVLWFPKTASFCGEMIEKNMHSQYHQDRVVDLIEGMTFEIIGNIHENPELIKESV